MSIKVSNYNISNNKFKKDPTNINMTDSALVRSTNRQINTLPSNFLKGAYGVLPFKTQTFREMTNNVPFTSNPLYDINLRKLVGKDTYSLIPAKFSKLIFDSAEDNWAMEDLSAIWKDVDGINYSKIFSREFLSRNDKKNYFVVEIVDGSTDLKDRIKCIIQTVKPQKIADRDNLEVKLLQAEPTIANNVNSALRGSGELSLYGAVRLAQENGFKNLKASSSNDSFYEKMGLKKIGKECLYHEYSNSGGIFQLSSDRYSAFLKRIEDKYEIN